MTSIAIGLLALSGDHRKLFEIIPEHLKNSWNEWALEGLILISVASQIVLFLLGNLRKHNPRTRIRITLWCAYLLANAVASAALGVITKSALDVYSNSHPNSQQKKLTSELMSFWAPFLLLHLGGPDTITAYSLEDNELWLRHLAELGFQSGVAVYILLLSLPGFSDHLPLLSISIYLAGFIKCFERVQALRLANTENLRESMLGSPDPGPNYPKFMEEFQLRKSQGFSVRVEEVPETSLPVIPAVIPLGTGNDLSRSFGWGGSFPLFWRSAIKRILDKATFSPTSRLDSWKLSISMPSGINLDTPHSLKQTDEVVITQQDLEVLGKLPEKVSSYQGVFYNYFSIGMDAQVAYGFHHLRNEKPYLARGPISNKVIYSGYSCTQGWFFTPCMADPGLRGLKNILRLHVKRLNSSEWELVPIPSSVRSIVALNLHSYASGRNPWGKLKPDYMEKKGFVEANADDGLLEVFGFKHGWHASFVMVELISAKHIAQAAAIRFELRGEAWKKAFMQMDGEPWKQPLKNEYSTFVDIERVPFRSVMIHGG